ncbi:hypothetical protein [Saccharococcus sp. Marseille-Q5394]|uniref:hypothetical protein n=1 Tax=Saccharococcus sp. Marseille-Q5394 TaxID=2972778 RepID=UPI0021C74F71|nr:hypothetical protein [Saccharococcus sp. Marseille-Q5394]
MMKKMKKLKQFFVRLFKKKNNKQKVSRTIKRIEQLRDMLPHLDHKFSVEIEGLKQTYHAELFQYDREYREYAEKRHKYDMGRLSEEEYQTASKKLQPFTEAMEKAKAELENAEEVKKEKMQRLLAEIEALQDAYINDLAVAMEDTAHKLQQIRQDYLKMVADIADLNNHAMQTDTTLRKYNRIVGLHYDNKLLRAYEIGVNSVEFPSLEITTTDIHKALKNRLKTRV